jgi:type III restriction enzyme
MSEPFFQQPILNTPYDYPGRHWELDRSGQPTGRIVERRRIAEFVTPVPRARKQGPARQAEFKLDALSSDGAQYDTTGRINDIRARVDAWRALPEPAWGVSAETARLLRFWRGADHLEVRPFFCQVEAVETAIWLHEVAPQSPDGRRLLASLKQASDDANPGLLRFAFKLATGAGKTTVMAMLIAWQTVNFVRRPGSRRFTNAFLIVTPGITIRDRLRVLNPADPDNYYEKRRIVPPDLLPELRRAQVIITNYHAFKHRERAEMSAGTRKLLAGHGDGPDTSETPGEMLRRVLAPLMSSKNILVINDEAHHCYQQRPAVEDGLAELAGEERDEAKENQAVARLWLSGLREVQQQLGLQAVYDLSATPFFLSGSGYVEGTLFPWTVSNFALIDAIECGIVKLPRVPVADNVSADELPTLRTLWQHVGKQMPKARGKKQFNDPAALPVLVQTAFDALYGHYLQVLRAWQAAGSQVPPVFIVVCNNTATSRLVYDYLSGYQQPQPDGSSAFVPGRLAELANFDRDGNRYPRPRTILIDSRQLESGEAPDPDFRAAAADEIARYRDEILLRSGNQQAADNITDAELLREVMNTVGKSGALGEQVRCVVSVSMLTEGWDANNVTHILGLRAFSTQLLCEQVVGRALRRQNYETGSDGLLPVEYADVLGVPFDFTARPVLIDPKPIQPTVNVKAVSPERDALTIRFPRVSGYTVALPPERLTVHFHDDHRLILTPELVGPSITTNAGLIGRISELRVDYDTAGRDQTLAFELTHHLLTRFYRDGDGNVRAHLFSRLLAIVRQWLAEGYLECRGDTSWRQLRYLPLADMACERMHAAITGSLADERPVLAVLDPYTPFGSSADVNFKTRKPTYATDARRSHVNYVVADSGWEAEFARVCDSHPRVRSYVKNQSLGFEVPYRLAGEQRRYLPDFIVQLDDGRRDLLNLVVEVKGYRGEDAQQKALTMQSFWVPGVNNLAGCGRWDFLELREPFGMAAELTRRLDTPG